MKKEKLLFSFHWQSSKCVHNCCEMFTHAIITQVRRANKRREISWLLMMKFGLYFLTWKIKQYATLSAIIRSLTWFLTKAFISMNTFLRNHKKVISTFIDQTILLTSMRVTCDDDNWHFMLVSQRESYWGRFPYQ